MAQTQRSSAGGGFLPHGLWLFPRRGYRLRLRRRSKALQHEPPPIHVWGVGQVASIQMIELIRLILKVCHSAVGKSQNWARHTRGTLMLTKANRRVIIASSVASSFLI